MNGEQMEAGEAHLLPTNLLPDTVSRQTTMMGVHVTCRRAVFESLMRKGAWKKLIPMEGSRGVGDVSWRGDMPAYVERGIRRRVMWELERMMKVLPKKAVFKVDEKGDWEQLVQKEIQHEGGESLTAVGCFLDWGAGVGNDQSSEGPSTMCETRKFKGGVEVMLHNMEFLFPGPGGDPVWDPSASDVKRLLGLTDDVTKAVIVLHHQTYTAQMWLMKLRWYLS